jgi:flagellar protein FlaG
MDIQNTLSGQPFAQRSGSSAASIVSERSGRSDVVPLDSPAQRGERSTNLLENTELRREGDASQNSSQGSSDQADNQQREVTGEALRQAFLKTESFLQVQNILSDYVWWQRILTVDPSCYIVSPSWHIVPLKHFTLAGPLMRIQELQQDVGVSVGVFINNEV